MCWCLVCFGVQRLVFCLALMCVVRIYVGAAPCTWRVIDCF
jgi:hypothetical protein